MLSPEDQALIHELTRTRADTLDAILKLMPTIHSHYTSPNATVGPTGMALLAEAVLTLAREMQDLKTTQRGTA